mmetsp:Transcript_8400/g.19476  ORF Transcript_8400/g.19476 Transcript_8400/m.19476 type:complete len:139 (-) Transcript_8400:854-1270(-)
MSRFVVFVALLVLALNSVSAFTVPTKQSKAFVTKLYSELEPAKKSSSKSNRFAPLPEPESNDESNSFELPSLPAVVQRGVSVDQDGNSNVWALEPRVELETTPKEQKMMSVMIGGGVFVALAAVSAVLLANLPNPNQY